MLVLIVVAAATAFSFFVASYEKQVLAQETSQHDRALETGRVLSIQICTSAVCPALYDELPTSARVADHVVNVAFVSSDPNTMVFTNYLLDGTSVQSWLLFNTSGKTPAWMASADGGCTLSPPVNASCGFLAPFEAVNLTLILPYAATLPTPISLSIFTSLSDVFSYEFVPPVAIVQTTILPEGTYSEPLFDASSSYQPSGGDNASIVSYTWYFWDVSTSSNVTPSSPYTGPQIEVSQFSSAETSQVYDVTLIVANSDGLTASTSVYYSS